MSLLVALAVAMTVPVVTGGSDGPNKVFFLTGIYQPNTFICYVDPQVFKDEHYITLVCAAKRPKTDDVYYYNLRLLKDDT